MKKERGRSGRKKEEGKKKNIKEDAMNKEGERRKWKNKGKKE